MIKRDKNFRLPKSTKRMMAFMEKDKSDLYKKLMIGALIFGSIPVKSSKKKDTNHERNSDSSS